MARQSSTLYGKRSWLLGSDRVALAVTEQGGMMAPVRFFRDSETPFEPYYVNPWHSEEIDVNEPVLEPLRGDFFCMPFGAGSAYRGVSYTTHGETATGRWTFVDDAGGSDGAGSSPGVQSLVLRMDTRAPAATVTKRIQLRDGEDAIYIQHRVEGGSGRTPLGHHATLGGTTAHRARFAADGPDGDAYTDGAPPRDGGQLRDGGQPAAAVGAGEDEPGYVADRFVISTSRIRFGRTQSRAEMHFAGGEYFSLLPNTHFEDLTAVPTVRRDEPGADCSRFPARPGFVDILGVCADPSLRPAWTAVVDTREGVLWYSLKDPEVLPITVFWMENYGRHQPPWNGRNSCIGLEEVCGYLSDGMEPSLEENDFTTEGVPTAVDLGRSGGVTVNLIHGAVRVPAGFGKVAEVETKETGLIFTDASGHRVETRVDHGFIDRGELS